MHFNKIKKKDAWEELEKKWTDPSMSAKRKWRTYCHLSDGRQWRWKKSVEQEKVTNRNWNIYVLCQCIYFVMRWNNCILHNVRHTYCIRVENSQVNQNFRTFFLWKHVLVHWLLAWKFWTGKASYLTNYPLPRNVASVPNFLEQKWLFWTLCPFSRFCFSNQIN
jgi:hypothetical protein